MHGRRQGRSGIKLVRWPRLLAAKRRRTRKLLRNATVTAWAHSSEQQSDLKHKLWCFVLRQKAVHLARMTCFGTRSIPAGRKSSMLGRKSQSFQERVGAHGSELVVSRTTPKLKSEHAAELRFAESVRHGIGTEQIE